MVRQLWTLALWDDRDTQRRLQRPFALWHMMSATRHIMNVGILLPDADQPQGNDNVDDHNERKDDIALALPIGFVSSDDSPLWTPRPRDEEDDSDDSDGMPELLP